MDYIFERGKFTEEELEKAIIELYEKEGYEYVYGETMSRNPKEVLLKEDLKKFLYAQYETEEITETEVLRAISKLENISASPLYDGNRDTYRIISEGFDLSRDDSSKLSIHINFINFNETSETPENKRNIFKVINQYTVVDVRESRPDLLIFINGIPIGICEFKTAIEEGKTVFNAWEQIHKRYTWKVPKLLKYVGMSVISDGANNRLGTIFTPYPYYYAWNKANDHDKVSNGISSLFTLIKGAFSKDRILKIYRDFIFYPDQSNKETAIICRYPQFFASNKMLENIKKHLQPTGDGKGGIYFGATGCGKTYTMLFLSRLMMLRAKDDFNNPTIILITDREDLDTQASELFVTAKIYLHDNDVRSIENRDDLLKTLKDKPSGGVYITTIQKFCEKVGLLSERNNIICISDEAHRSQTGIGAKLKKTNEGVFTSYGYAEYLRKSFPNATYCGFTGTPIDESIAVFGDIVDSYTMKESSDDGITVRIAYEPRLARVILSEEQAKEIQKYYEKCKTEGSTEEQIKASQDAMSAMTAILGHPDRLKKLAKDIVEHYEKLTSQKPEIVQKAMIVCSEREIAFTLLKEILDLRKDWGTKKKSEDDSKLTKTQLDKLVALPKINMVATQGLNDSKELAEICGTKEKHKMLDKQFKNNDSNFKIAIVVDMWITGFDVPSLAVMYIDKPLKKHTLIQTISRVNRVFEGKDKGLIVDYIGIKNNMMEAIKQYGSPQESPVDEINTSLIIFRNHLKLIDDLLINFNATRFFVGKPLERLECLNDGAEYIQRTKDMEKRFMTLSRKMKAAYEIVFPSGELTDAEISKAQFYLAIRSIIYKQTRGDAPDTEIMNQVVEEMVRNAITCTGIENIVDEDKSFDLFSEEFQKQLKSIKLPISKFNALIKLLKKAISQYGQTNKVKAGEFDKRLKIIIEKYNNRDKLVFTSEVVADFVDGLSDEILKILKDLVEDQNSFAKLGITFEEKAFYDILVKVRDDHKFQFADEKCIVLAKKIKELVDDKAQFADWSTRDDIKNELNMELTVLLYENGYPPEWDEEVFDKVMEQAENYKKNN